MIYGVILASGLGTRFSDDLPKQFVKIAGKTVIEHTIEAFERFKEIDSIIVVITPQYRHVLEEILLRNSYKKIGCIVNGGDTRKESSSIAISTIADDDSSVIIHDCARPFVSDDILRNCLAALQKYDAVDVAIDSADTLIEINDRKEIKNIPVRQNMRRGQTPQCFKVSVIRKAHQLAAEDNNFTDDCGLVVKYNLCPVYVVTGEEKNIKITMPEDIFLADKFFQMRSVRLPNPKDFAALSGKVIVVFGGHSGIGKEIADISKSENAIVYPLSLRDGTDISDYDCVQRKLSEIYEKEGSIDYIINSAGVLNMGKVSTRDIDDIREEIAINYIGSINVAKASIEYLKKSRGGILFFTSSSYTRGRALYSIYSSTKAAIVNLTQALSEELYADGIRVNVVNPERTATPMRFKNFGKEPSGSLLCPAKVAKSSISVILSDLTGQVIDVRR